MKLLPCLIAVALAGLAAVSLRAADAQATFKVADLTFKQPANWELLNAGPAGMRAAELRVTDPKSKEAADVVFFHFPGGGGGTKANVDRWLSKFQESREKIGARTDESTIGKHKVTYVEAEGTYDASIPGAAAKKLMPNHRLQGAILEPDGIYIRMTGPSAVVKGASADFKKMVEAALK